jgi:tRNA 2-thiouridine synthesizing protein E
MGTFTFKDKTYEVDAEEFLLDSNKWDQDFAAGMAPWVDIHHGLTKDHWDVIHFIRKRYAETGRCPLVYQVCLVNRLSIEELEKLFPTGYLRGACKVAGVTYRDSFAEFPIRSASPEDVPPSSPDKVYRVDINGFLVDPDEWDEPFTIAKAYEMKMKDKLTNKHWQIIDFLRKQYRQTKVVPTVYETCKANKLTIEDLERLFPDGYHRGAVKLAGLRVR